MRRLLSFSLLALAFITSACEPEECVGAGEVSFTFAKVSQSDEAVYLTGDVEWMYCGAPEDDSVERRSYALSVTDGESARIDEVPASSVVPLQGDDFEFPVKTGTVKLIDGASANVNVKDLHVGDLMIGSKTYDLWVDVSVD